MAQAGGLAAIVASDQEVVMLMRESDPQGSPAVTQTGASPLLLPKSQDDLLMRALSQERVDVRVSAHSLFPAPQIQACLGLLCKLVTDPIRY